MLYVVNVPPPFMDRRKPMVGSLLKCTGMTHLFYHSLFFDGTYVYVIQDPHFKMYCEKAGSLSIGISDNLCTVLCAKAFDS